MTSSDITYPVNDALLVPRACKPDALDPGDKRWYDFSALRHARVQQTLVRSFSITSPSEPHHQLLCGHKGSGKTTELLHFKKWAGNNGFTCVHVDVFKELGYVNLAYSDLFLLAATETERSLKELGSPLPEKTIRSVVEWFAEVTRVNEELLKSELGLEARAQLEGGLPFLGKLMAKLAAGIKAGASHSTVVREKIRDNPNKLIALTRDLLNQANESLAELEETRNRGLILLFDNLDRYNAEQINHVLIKSSPLLQDVGCHAVYTIPIELEYNPGSRPLRDSFGPPIVLPMIPLRNHDSGWRDAVDSSGHMEEAVQGMRNAVAKRINVGSVFENPSDVDGVIRMSGGCIRDLMHLLSQSYIMSDGDQISTAGVKRAIRQLRAHYVRHLSAADYSLLAKIPGSRSLPENESIRRLLGQRLVLEYYDSEYAVWWDVHPLVVELRGFQDAYRQHLPIRET
jgi:hypothetical protein